MIDIETLPREPGSAVQELIHRMLGIIPTGGNGSLADLGRARPRDLTSLKLHAVTCIRVANRIEDEEVRDVVKKSMIISDGMSYSALKKTLEDAYAAITLTRLDEHFLDSESVNEFDRAELNSDDKQKITDLLFEAKGLATRASFLSERNKRRIIFHISKIENELYKEVSKFSTFLAAAADVSGLVRKYGEDAMPIAEAIQTARTITERKVEGYVQIEKDEEPKKLPKPSNDD